MLHDVFIVLVKFLLLNPEEVCGEQRHGTDGISILALQGRHHFLSLTRRAIIYVFHAVAVIFTKSRGLVSE